MEPVDQSRKAIYLIDPRPSSHSDSDPQQRGMLPACVLYLIEGLRPTVFLCNAVYPAYRVAANGVISDPDYEIIICVNFLVYRVSRGFSLDFTSGDFRKKLPEVA